MRFFCAYDKTNNQRKISLWILESQIQYRILDMFGTALILFIFCCMCSTISILSLTFPIFNKKLNMPAYCCQWIKSFRQDAMSYITQTSIKLSWLFLFLLFDFLCVHQPVRKNISIWQEDSDNSPPKFPCSQLMYVIACLVQPLQIRHSETTSPHNSPVHSTAIAFLVQPLHARIQKGGGGVQGITLFLVILL